MPTATTTAIVLRKKRYTQAGAKKLQIPNTKSRIPEKLTILVRMLTLLWTGPQIHEDPKENQLTIGRSTHRAIYTHMWGGPGPGPAPDASAHVCVDRLMGRSPDG